MSKLDKAMKIQSERIKANAARRPRAGIPGIKTPTFAKVRIKKGM